MLVGHYSLAKNIADWPFSGRFHDGGLSILLLNLDIRPKRVLTSGGSPRVALAYLCFVSSISEGDPFS